MGKVMAIDASTKSTGVAIFDENTKELIKYFCLTCESSSVKYRILQMVKQIMLVYKENCATKVVMEDVLLEDVGHNTNVFKSLHYLQAAVVLKFFEEEDLEVTLMPCGTWRSKCGFKGGPSATREVLKAQSMAFVKDKYGIEANDDVSDAICLGWAYVNKGADLVGGQGSKPAFKKKKQDFAF